MGYQMRPTSTAPWIIGAAVLLVASALAVGYARSRGADVQPSIASAGPRHLVFGDDFDGTALDQGKWNTCYDNYSVKRAGCTNYGNDESEWYQASQVRQAGGVLSLTAQKRLTGGQDAQGRSKDYAYSSGMISTGRFLPQTPEKWSRTYGLYEARINAPAGDAVWPAFWLSPIDHGWPPEIDVMELLGQKPRELINTYFWKGDGSNYPKDSSTFVSAVPLTGSWHVYAIDWQPGSITWYLDGKRVKQSTGNNVPDVPMQMNLNLAVGGNLPGPPTASTPEQSVMNVDYVRVYK